MINYIPAKPPGRRIYNSGGILLMTIVLIGLILLILLPLIAILHGMQTLLSRICFSLFFLLLWIPLSLFYDLATGFSFSIWCTCLFLILLSMLVIWKPFEVKRRKQLRVGISIIFVIAIGTDMGMQIYKDSVVRFSPDEGETSIYHYQPFNPGTKAVRLSEPSTLSFTDNLPRMDGATALYPVYAAFAQALYPEGQYSPHIEYTIPAESPEGSIASADTIPSALSYPTASDLGAFEVVSPVLCSRTSEAFQRLLNGDADIIFLMDISAAQRERAGELGIELEFTPIGREAFVFLVNSRNRISELSQDEIRGIYSGEITNWKQCGDGKISGRIDPYQRPEGSGSQTALESIMGNTPIMTPETEKVQGMMGGLYQSVASYRNYRNALGYSFRYYVLTMLGDDELNQVKLLAIDGIQPTQETIADGSYPFADSFYAITVSNREYVSEEELARAHNTGLLIEWILTKQGQEIIEKTGYVPVSF
jgi:phosphate transport system substrate-binding protein